MIKTAFLFSSHQHPHCLTSSKLTARPVSAVVSPLVLPPAPMAAGKVSVVYMLVAVQVTVLMVIMVTTMSMIMRVMGMVTTMRRAR